MAAGRHDFLDSSTLDDDWSPSTLAVRIDCRPDEVRCTLSGEIDLATVDILRRALDSALDRRCGRVVVDLAAVEFLDAGALRVFEAAALAAQASDQVLMTQAPSLVARRMFELGGLTWLVDTGAGPG